MQNRSTGGIDLQLSKRSDSGGRAVTSAVDARQLLYFLLLIPAGIVSMLPLGVYPPLDARLPMGFIIGAFLLSAVPQLTSIVRREPGNSVGWWRKVSICSGLALPLIGLLLFLNGRLDRSAPNDVRAMVIRKIAPAGHREAQYHLAGVFVATGQEYRGPQRQLACVWTRCGRERRYHRTSQWIFWLAVVRQHFTRNEGLARRLMIGRLEVFHSRFFGNPGVKNHPIKDVLGVR
jgi:hypothetical protein